MNLIKRISNWLFNNERELPPEVVEDKAPIISEERRRNIILQRQEDHKWTIRVMQKAEQRYRELTATTSFPILDSTRYTDMYTVYDEQTAKYKDGVEKAIQNLLSHKLSRKDKVPKGTIPSTKIR